MGGLTGTPAVGTGAREKFYFPRRKASLSLDAVVGASDVGATAATLRAHGDRGRHESGS